MIEDAAIAMQALPVLNERFADQESFERRTGGTYALLPLRFIALDAERHVLTNFAGEYVVLPKATTQQFIRHQLDRRTAVYDELKSKHFLMDGDSNVALDLLSVKYRTKQAFLSRFTSLFLFVVSLRCDHSCPYCQVSRQSQDRHAFDMSVESADRAIEFLFHSPSPTLKVEFQGGEPLLNFDLIRHIIERVEDRNQNEGRDIQYVIATNLAFLTDAMLAFCKQHPVLFSTSLDGPRELHNRNRPRPRNDSYERTVDGIQRVREALGPDRIAALMTTTESSLTQLEAIIDEYAQRGFSSIFLRPISPFGFAVKTGMASRYASDDWLEFYRTGLDYILRLNQQGTPFVEEYARLILRKMLTPYATGYVDLQSPAGIGIGCLVFNYDGDIYASDEARMLAETGDKTFRLGNLHEDSFADVMLSDALLQPLGESMAECVPMCTDCGFLPYCGSDPVFHHATQGNVVGFKPTSGFCRKNMGVIRHLIRLLEDDADAAAMLRSWV